jgi:CheY-like chemotaxis protein
VTIAPNTTEAVLVVEDNPDARETLLLALEQEGYPAVGAANGREALHYLGECPPPCLILLDLSMPVMDGWEFRKRQLQEPEWAAIPVVVLSALANHTERAAELGPVERLVKPVNFDTLLEKIQQLCQRPGEGSLHSG